MSLEVRDETPGPLRRFLEALRTEGIERVCLDEPAEPAGPWWLDLKIDGQRHSVVWQRDRGFGLFVDGPVFAEHPDEVSRSPEDTASRLLQIMAERSRQLRNTPVTLQTLRRLRGRNQLDLANVLHKRQSAISKLENSSDPKLSTLSEYVGAVGGRLVLSVEFPDADSGVALAIGRAPPKEDGSGDNEQQLEPRRPRKAA